MVEQGITIEPLKDAVYQDSEVTVVGETNSPNGIWEEFRAIYLATNKPAYNLKGIKVAHAHLIELGFREGIPPTSSDYALSFGYLELQYGPKRKLSAHVYPDKEIAKIAYKLVRGRLDGTLKSMPVDCPIDERYIRNDELRRRAIKRQIRPFLSAIIAFIGK